MQIGTGVTLSARRWHSRERRENLPRKQGCSAGWFCCTAACARRAESILVPFGPARRDIARLMQHRGLPSAEDRNPFADGFDEEHQNHHG